MTSPAPVSHRGYVKGEFQDFVHGHHARLQPRRLPTLGIDHSLQDRGYVTLCWGWLGFIEPKGYAIVGDSEKAHRRSYIAAKGPVPKGMILHHLCEQRDCVNPDHLQPMTRKDHARLHLRRLTEDEVRLILESDESRITLSTRLGISRKLVSRIRVSQGYPD